MSLDIHLSVPIDGTHLNLTHNLGRMAGEVRAEAGTLYQLLWRPEEIYIHEAEELIEPLTEALVILISGREILSNLNPENGWGDYDRLLEVTIAHLHNCQKFPHGKIEVDR